MIWLQTTFTESVFSCTYTKRSKYQGWNKTSRRGREDTK